MRAIDADALKRRAQRVATEAWKLKLTASVETTLNQYIDWINQAPTIEPEPHYDEWCTDCKEYDHERHCCPRWNRVIRETLKDAQPNTDHIYAELSKVYNVKGLPDEAIGIIGDLMLSLDGPSAQPERTEKRTETHACDCISRQAAMDANTRAVER